MALVGLRMGATDDARSAAVVNSVVNSTPFAGVRSGSPVTPKRSDLSFSDVSAPRRTRSRLLGVKGSQVQILSARPFGNQGPFGVHLEDIEGAFPLVGPYGTGLDRRVAKCAGEHFASQPHRRRQSRFEHPRRARQCSYLR